MRKHKGLDVRIVLDTNALFTGSAHYFVRKEIVDAIQQYRSLPDLRLSWYVPATVKDERQFQMLSEGRKLLEPLTRLERLLGHNLGITPDILETRVREAIDKQVADVGISILPFKPGDIDWERLALDAVYRRPPFQTGEKEKGFRDALILEAFLQLKQSIPGSPAACRLVLVTGDDLLRTAAEERTSTDANVHIFASIDELKGLISALGSTADETFISAIRPKAERLFYVAGDQASLYYKWGVHKQLSASLTAGDINLPAGAVAHAVESWQINRPRFAKKDGSRMTWVSRFEAKIKATKPTDVTTIQFFPPQYDTTITPNVKSFLDFSSEAPADFQFSTPKKASELSAFDPAFATYFSKNMLRAASQEVARGTATVDVTWTCTVTTAKVLRSPVLDAVSFVDCVWT